MHKCVSRFNALPFGVHESDVVFFVCYRTLEFGIYGVVLYTAVVYFLRFKSSLIGGS